MAWAAAACALAWPAPVAAQVRLFAPGVIDLADELETDRDAFTPATRTVGRQRTVLETSYSFIDNRLDRDTHSLPELLVRYGATERLELRWGWNLEMGGEGNVVSSDEGDENLQGLARRRESTMLYGFKHQTTLQAGWLPRSCFIVEGFTPTSGEATATDLVATYAWGWELANRWRLDSAIRYGTGNDLPDRSNRWAPSVVLRMPVTDRWNVHAEYFGVFTDGLASDVSHAFVSPGTHYLVTPDLELGVRVGWGITSDAGHFFSNVGLGYRF